MSAPTARTSAGMHALDGRLGADRHERRRAHDAVRRRDLAGARRAIGGEDAKAEMQFVIHARPVVVGPRGISWFWKAHVFLLFASPRLRGEHRRPSAAVLA